MNIAILIGNVTRDIEVKQTNGGTYTTSFSIAINRPKDKNGVVGVDYPNIVAWGTTAQNAAKYLSKGKKCAIIGTIRTRSYEKDGKKVYVTEVYANQIEYLSPVVNAMENMAAGAVEGVAGFNTTGGSTDGFEETDEDPLPF